MSRTRSSGLLAAALVLAGLPAGAQKGQSVALDLEPFVQPFGAVELEPVLAGDKVLVSSTLRLFAVDAAKCELAWSAGPPAGWEALAGRRDLFQAVYTGRLLVVPAAGTRVAVAALQVPQARAEIENWQGIDIVKALPERRLFAFELATGRELWNHAPPPDWDGSSGPFARRMRVIGSPLVAGESVLAACTYDDSSIDYWVASYELASGALEWATFVTRGQIERNMFGNQVLEFVAAPLALDAQHGRVLAQTDLGLVVALDVASGEIAWRAEYAPIPLPRTKSYQVPRRVLTWRTTPPLVVGNTLLATPSDSRELLAFDLEDGSALWKLAASELSALVGSSEGRAFDHLIGADEDVLYFGGTRLFATRLSGGLRSPLPPELLWTAHIVATATGGRARIAGDSLFHFGGGGCLAFERDTGKERGALTQDQVLGLLATDEAFFLLTPKELRQIER